MLGLDLVNSQPLISKFTLKGSCALKSRKCITMTSSSATMLAILGENNIVKFGKILI